MEVKVKKVHPQAILPKFATEEAACADLYCCEPFSIANGELVKVRTGLVFDLPKGYMIDVRPRSGMSGRGIILINAPGTIDSDYRGEVLVMLYGLAMIEPEFFEVGARIAQARLVKLEDYTFEEVQEVSKTNRGSTGFGSTGK